MKILGGETGSSAKSTAAGGWGLQRRKRDATMTQVLIVERCVSESGERSDGNSRWDDNPSDKIENGKFFFLSACAMLSFLRFVFFPPTTRTVKTRMQ